MQMQKIGHIDYAYINRYRDIGSIKFVEKEERKQEGGHECRTEHKTRSTQNTCRNIEKKAYTHDTDS